MVAPSSVLRITAGNDPPLMALDARVTYLERHLTNQLLPTVLEEVHNGHRLIRSRQRREDGDTIA